MKKSGLVNKRNAYVHTSIISIVKVNELSTIFTWFISYDFHSFLRLKEIFEGTKEKGKERFMVEHK